MNAKRDTYQVITDTILASLDKCGPFQRPWAAKSLTMPVNETTGRSYRGSNVVMLWITAVEQGYSENRWATFKQWAEKGATVRKGEKGTPVVWFQMIDRKNADAGENSDADDATRKVPCARLSWVFNIAQVDGYAANASMPPPQNLVSPIEQADALILASGAAIEHAGDRAYYRPSTDQIVLPTREAFHGTETMTPTEAYYATALHELVHWTGSSKRLNRELANRYGTEAYAFEELVAELGAAFLCASLGVSNEPRADHAAYLASWAKLMQNDRRAFTAAAARAAEASDYLLAFIAEQEHAEAA